MQCRMKKGALIVLALGTMVLAACGVQEQSMPELEPATLRVGVPFGRAEEDPLLVAAVERFQEENPRVTVELVTRIVVPFYSEVDAWVEARELDLLLWGPDPTLVTGEQPVVLSLKPFISEAGDLDEKDFLPHLLDAYRWKGELYAIPADVYVELMYYNRDMFDAQGVAYPQPGWDWQDFLSTAERLTTVTEEDGPGAGHWGFVAHPSTLDFLPFILQHGGTLVDDPLRPTHLVLDDPFVAEALQWYADLGLVHKVMPIVQREQVDEYSRVPLDKLALQQAAMAIGGPGDQGGDVIPWNFEWGVAPLPHDGDTGSVIWARGLYITARTAYPQQAWALVRYLTESEQAVTRRVPARRSAAGSDRVRQQIGPEIADAVLASLDTDARIMVWYWNDRFFELYQRLEERAYWVVHGDDTAEEFMDRLQDSLASWSMEWP
jgi:ABC-type glycerol-3-phosphate transport system substrate-binding protein